MITQQILNIIANGVKEVVATKLVPDGLDSNFRELEITYTLNGYQVTEIRTYIFPADSKQWAAYNSTFDLKEVPNG